MEPAPSCRRTNAISCARSGGASPSGWLPSSSCAARARSGRPSPNSKRGSAKICLADHGLRATWLQEQVPLAPAELREKPDLATVAGFLAESVVGATLATIAGLDLAHLPARGDQSEIDFVLTVGTHRIPLEVKYQARPDPVRDTAGLRGFIGRPINRAPFGLLVTRQDDDVDYGPAVVALPLSTLMLLR